MASRYILSMSKGKTLNGGRVYGLEVPPLQEQGQDLVPDGKEEQEDDGEDHLHVWPRDEPEHAQDQQLHQLERKEKLLVLQSEQRKIALHPAQYPEYISIFFSIFPGKVCCCVQILENGFT